MTRRMNVKLAWIVDDNARKASLRKRRASLVKKISELTILCDVNGFIIIYSPDSDEPVVWPERSAVKQLLAMFQSIPDVERSKKMANQESYLNEMVAKIQEQIRKLKKKNNEMKMNDLLHDILHNGKPMHTFPSSELTSLVLFLRERMNEIQKRIEISPNVLPQGALPFEMWMSGGNFGGENYESEMGPHCFYVRNVEDSSNISLMPCNGSARNGVGLPPGSVGGNDGEDDFSAIIASPEDDAGQQSDHVKSP